MNKESRAYTAEEVREQFINTVISIADYWSDETGNLVPKERSTKDKVYGVVHSLLVLLDGGNGAMPAFDLIPKAHPDDKQYYIDNGENWYEPVVINECQLHELYCAKR